MRLYAAAIVLLASVPGIQWALAQGGGAEGSPRSQVVRRILPSAVRVQVLSGETVKRSASGVVVRAEPASAGKPARSLVLTNAHVLDPEGLTNVSYRVLLERRGRVERTISAELMALGEVPDMDLGVVSVNELLPSVELAAEEQVDVGDDVVAVGAPYGRSLSVSGGLVSQLVAEEGEAGSPLRYEAMKTDAAIGYGSSGGGVFSVKDGRLVGLVEGYRTARVAIGDGYGFDVPMPGETFVAPVTKIRRFLSRLDAPAPVGEAVAQREMSAETEKDRAPAVMPVSAPTK